MKERERAQERLCEQKRDRSSRQRDRADNTDSQCRVRARREQRAAEEQEKDELEAQIQRARERGIASGELLPIQRERLQFRDDAEIKHYDMQCGACGLHVAAHMPILCSLTCNYMATTRAHNSGMSKSGCSDAVPCACKARSSGTEPTLNQCVAWTHAYVQLM